MHILLVEPFFSGSHRQWAEGFQQYSRHQVDILSLPGRHWKWRMYGAAVSLARQAATLQRPPDLLLATDMLDLPTFLALLPAGWQQIPVALYFHENQITYPWSPDDPDLPLNRNNQYGFLNYTSALAADQLFFNSGYHRSSFLQALPAFLRQFPDFRELDLVPGIEAKSQVLYLGLDLQALEKWQTPGREGPPVILWNHRWEYDKNPEQFFSILLELQDEGLPFEVTVLGEATQKAPSVFQEARSSLASRIRHWGYCPSREAYARLLWEADLLPVVNRQDFFGASIVEAIFCRCLPLLPDRLSYPEHVPESLRPDLLYAHANDLKEKLRYALRQGALPDTLDQLQSLVARYDWRTLAAQYDRRLEQVTKSFGL